MFILTIECRPNAVGVGAKTQYHLRGAQPVHAHSGGRSKSVCVQQPATASTDNFALLHCTFQQGSTVPSAVDVSAPTSTFNLQHRSNSTLLRYYNQQQHRLASRPTAPRINLARAIRLSSTTRSCNTPTRLSFALLHIPVAGRTWHYSTA